jgi:large subunit ribosomal protein L4
VHVVSTIVEGDQPSTSAAVTMLSGLTDRRHVLVVIDRDDLLTARSVRNVPRVHLLFADQLNTYDVLVSDDVVFTKGAFDALVAGPQAGRSVKAVATSSEVPVDDPVDEPVEPVDEPATQPSLTKPTATEEATP